MIKIPSDNLKHLLPIDSSAAHASERRSSPPPIPTAVPHEVLIPGAGNPAPKTRTLDVCDNPIVKINAYKTYV